MLHSRSLLVTYLTYSGVHKSILCSWFIPPFSIAPLVTTSLFTISIICFCFINKFICIFLHLYSMYIIHLSFPVWLDWRWEEKGTTEDEMVGWHHRLDVHGFGWTLGVGDGQRGLECWGSWVRKESDTTEWLNWTEYSTGYMLPQLSYPFVSWWTSRLLPCPGYYNQCCDEH